MVSAGTLALETVADGVSFHLPQRAVVAIVSVHFRLNEWLRHQTTPFRRLLH